MKRLSKYLGYALAGMLALGIAACQNPKFYSGQDVTLELASVAAASVSLDNSYDAVVEILSKPQYSEAEKETLTLAKGSVDRVRAEFRQLGEKGKNQTFVVLTSDRAKTVYNELKDAYVKTRGVVIDHRADYSAADWNYLMQLNASVLQLDKDVESIWKAKDNVDARWQAALLRAAQDTAEILQLMKESRH